MLVLTQAVSAATLQGAVYDFSLNKLTNIIVEINTQPTQRQIAINGTYSFNVPQGSYNLLAKNIDNKILVEENITINKEGTYTLDLISFIDLEEEQDLLNDTSLDLGSDLGIVEDNGNNWFIPLIIIILIALSIGYYYFRKKKLPKKTGALEETDLTNKVLEFMKKEQGRVTQKDLRKNFPYSEAKISLILTELESKGKIEKIKKGRSNVIILKK